MHLLLVGISHRTAPIELRERVDFQARGVDRALDAIAALARAEPDLTGFLSDFHGLQVGDLAPHLYHLADLEAARHLFRVAAGLDSLVVGEPQILGQVKEAHTAAADAQAVGPVLNRLFHSSFVAGKRVRHETSLGAGAVSVSYAAAALARKIFGDLKGRNVLVV